MLSLSSEKFMGVWNTYAYILVFGLIYLEWSFSALVATQISGVFRNVAMILLVLPLLLRLRRTRIDKCCLVLFAGMLVLICINYLRDGDFSNNFLLAVTVVVGFFVALFFTPREFGRVFENVVVFLAAFSLPVFTLSVIAPGVIDRLPLIATSYMDQQGVQVHNALFSIGITHSIASRNCGIAWEPGAFSILLCVALFFTLLYPSKRKMAKVAVLAIAELTTLSTMGIAVMCALFLVMFMGRSGVKKRAIAFMVFIAFFGAVSMGLMDYALQTLFSKLGGLFSSTQTVAVTTQDRLNAIYYMFEAFAESPFFGVGYERFSYINVNLCNSAATNTFVNWFALMGFVFAFPCVFGYFRAVLKALKRLEVNKFTVLAVVCASVLMLATEDLIRISLVYVFVFYGCAGLLDFRSDDAFVHSSEETFLLAGEAR